jgi:hypothetical protein
MTVTAETTTAAAAGTETPVAPAEKQPTSTPTPSTTPSTDAGGDEFSIQDALNGASAEELAEWQLKGTIPSKKDKSGKTDASAASNADTAAAAAAATTQKSQPPAKSERRWKELSERLGNLQRENEELKRQASGSGKSETQTSQPAPDGKPKADPKPKIDDVDPKTGKAKYANYAEYEDAKEKWLRDDIKRELAESTAKSDQERTQKATETAADTAWNQRMEAVQKAHPDFVDTAKAALGLKDELGRELIFFPKKSAIDQYLQRAENGEHVLYHILKTPQDYKHIFARDAKGMPLLTAVEQVAELAILSHTLKAEAGAAGDGKHSSAPRKSSSALPPPPTELGARNTTPADEADAALARGDTAGYMKAMNNREIKARRR